ncbi:glycosyltransferase [Nocardioides sp. NPDC006273]|uniref:glycosyltransferase family 2 protein n=1 Tax=Nocardioides sp. NPDC006273 TaxID=3155598 RepID=UPI0033A7D037
MTQPVWVCMLTYRRPEGLAEAIGMLRTQLDLVPGARMLVVDNDEQPSAAAAVAQAADGDTRVVYAHEPTPGIAAARNRALAEAGPDAVVVFIDDDEQPSQRWLPTLLTCWQETGAAGVVGPVVSTFAAEPDPWITAGGFFVRLRHATGTVVTTAATNNLLLDMRQVGSLRFDLGFGLSGGSDTVFTRTLSAGGGRIVWCDEAPVHDLVPTDRSTREWVRARASRIGNSDSRVQVYLAPRGRRPMARLRATARGLVRLLGGSARIVLGRLTGSSAHHARGTRTMLRGLGMLRGAWGSYVTEYGR